MQHPPITFWRPTQWRPSAHNTGFEVVEDVLGVGRVRVFSHDGRDERRMGAAFTSCEMHAWGMTFSRKYDRCYHPRWFGRLASDFAWECKKIAKQEALIV